MKRGRAEMKREKRGRKRTEKGEKQKKREEEKEREGREEREATTDRHFQAAVLFELPFQGLTGTATPVAHAQVHLPQREEGTNDKKVDKEAQDGGPWASGACKERERERDKEIRKRTDIRETSREKRKAGQPAGQMVRAGQGEGVMEPDLQ